LKNTLQSIADNRGKLSTRIACSEKKVIDPSRRSRRHFLLRHLYLYPACLGVTFVLSDPFLPVMILRLLMSALLSVFPFLAVIRVLYSKRSMLLRAQSKVLLQSLCTSVSGGYSLESALMCARGNIEKAFGQRSLMGAALIRLEKSLSAHEPVGDCLVEMCRRLDYIELLPVMHALSISRVVGTGVISILRNSCQMLSELMAVRSEVEANNSGKNAEAFILCLMPFGITFALSTFSSDYMSVVKSNPLGNFMMLLAFIIAVISCALLFRIIGENDNKKLNLGFQEEQYPTFVNRIVNQLGHWASKYLPQSYLTRQHELFGELSQQPQLAFYQFIAKTIAVVIFTMPLSMFILNSLNQPLWISPGIAFLLTVLMHQDLNNKVMQRRECIMQEIPLFLSMLVTLLQSGMLLPKAIDTCSAAFHESSVLGNELRYIKAHILSGHSAGTAIEAFSARTAIPEAQSALLLAARFELSGGSEVLSLLSLQSNSCWSLSRNASRKKREREALSMIFPMMLDFVSVLIVAISPALISLKF